MRTRIRRVYDLVWYWVADYAVVLITLVVWAGVVILAWLHMSPDCTML